MAWLLTHPRSFSPNDVTLFFVQVLETREELELVTEKLDFVRDAATIRVGNVAAKTRIVQVHRKGIRVLDHAAKSVQDMACGDLVTSLRQDPAWAADLNDPNEPKGSADDRIEIREAAISDPFVLLVLTDDTLCVFQHDAGKWKWMRGSIREILGQVRQEGVG